MKAYVETLGCKVNQFESSSIIDQLKSAGYEICASPAGADLLVLNTCTVTHKADHEALALLRRLKRINPTAKVVATGCLAQSNPDFLAESGLVNMVLGQNEKASLVSHLDQPEHNGMPVVLVATLEEGRPAHNFGSPAPEKTRAFYKIQDGCSAFCAYCAVPLSRGPSRSLPLDQVLAGLREYMGGGTAEVVLCGIHLGLWGRDLTPKESLAALLHTIDGELAPDPYFFRLRLSSIEPLEVDDEVLEAYQFYPWLAGHLHLPLQSGSDRVLEMMGRPYRAPQFKELIYKLKAKWPLMALGVDVMVGFPGETEEMFEETRQLLDELPLSYMHIFPYSIRPGTRAAESSGQVDEAVKKQRASILKQLNQEKRERFSRQNYGQAHLALVENTPHKPSGRLKVLTGNYLSALLPPGEEAPAGAMIPVLLSQPENEWNMLEARIDMTAEIF